jgi:hypothetical protein
LIVASTPLAATGAAAGADAAVDGGVLDDFCAAGESVDDEHPAAITAASTATPICARNAIARDGREMRFMLVSFPMDWFVLLVVVGPYAITGPAV